MSIMPFRPAVTYDGEQFTRERGTWVNRQRLEVAAAVRARLDALAKRDVELWARCRAQDAADSASTTTSRPVKLVAAKQNGVAKSTLKCRFDAARTLFVCADLHTDWRRRRTTWGFVGQDWVQGVHGNIVRVQLAVLTAWPCGAPKLVERTGVDAGIRATAAGHTLGLEVELFDHSQGFNTQLGWTETKNGKPQVFRQFSPVPLEELEQEAREGWGNYDFKLWIIAQPPATKPHPVYFEWSRRFFPGGLPSLGKRRS